MGGRRARRLGRWRERDDQEPGRADDGAGAVREAASERAASERATSPEAASGAPGEGESRYAYDILIRPMRMSDLDRVLQIEYVAFTMPWSSLTYRNLLERDDADLFVAESPEDGVVGYAGMWSVLDEGELGTLAVEPKRRGRGVASRLLTRVLARGAERGLKAIFLEVRVSNANARRLYESFDFRQVGLRRNYYAFPLEDAIVMRRADLAEG